MKSLLNTGRNSVLSSTDGQALLTRWYTCVTRSPWAIGNPTKRRFAESRAVQYSRHPVSCVWPVFVLHRLMGSLVFPNRLAITHTVCRWRSFIAGKMYCWKTYCSTDILQRTRSNFPYISWSFIVLQNVMHKKADFDKIYISFHVGHVPFLFMMKCLLAN